MMKLKTNPPRFLTIVPTCVLFLTTSLSTTAQNDSITKQPKQKSDFWQKVQFGGGFGLSIGGDYTNILIAPGAIYPINEKVAVGMGLQYSYAEEKDFYNSHLYGVTFITLINPIPEAQFSVELEQLRVNNTYTQFIPEIKENFWNTGLFLGLGYQSQNVTFGFRYNVLYREDKDVYGQAWMPFVRAYF
ncbi:hypothetical protein FLJC2902T_02430 [Flavobacterium limnosediminis JC2902]|uniref:Alpha-ketoglutarate decarboxylase n=1 Tax=Flavobacterium limnosediminis JC2902 TaxID=1341181 RepID=V6SUB8_9FLAO|nr:hypothetical protein [Flavobacterium limnosediminis]ESU29767.1 hypothetical protein FLJC2902T_02430 [Flavobacterium limnosediminis JC2902]